MCHLHCTGAHWNPRMTVRCLCLSFSGCKIPMIASRTVLPSLSLGLELRAARCTPDVSLKCTWSLQQSGVRSTPGPHNRGKLPSPFELRCRVTAPWASREVDGNRKLVHPPFHMSKPAGLTSFHPLAARDSTPNLTKLGKKWGTKSRL